MATSDAAAVKLFSATYKSPTSEPFLHTAELPAPASNAPIHRTAYLGALRAAVGEMQEKINKDLTSRMEDDKTRAASAAVDEAKEEDNYGEEVVEEE